MANILDRSDFVQEWQEVYLPLRKSGWPVASPVIAQAMSAKGSDVTFAGGGDLIFQVRLSRRGGFVSSSRGFGPEAADAPSKKGKLGIARTYAQLEVDGLALKALASTKGSYTPIINKLMDDLSDQWAEEQARVAHGDGLGIRAVIVGVAGAPTQITVEKPYGIASSGPGNLFLNVGDTCSVIDVSASNAHLGKAKITAISLSGDTATLTTTGSWDGSGTAAVGDYIVTAVPSATHASDNSFGVEPYGLKAIMDVEAAFSTFEGINDDRWVAQKLTSASGGISETLVMRLLNTIRARARVEDWRTNPAMMLLVTSTGIWQQYGESLLGLRRFSGAEMTINGGFTATKVAGAALIDDAYSPRGRLYAIHTPDLLKVDLMELGGISYEDSGEWRQVDNRDAFQKMVGTYWNFGCTMRNSHGVISGITDTVNYSPVY